MSTIQDLVIQLVRENPHASNEDIAEMVRQAQPGASTTAASVSSIKSRSGMSTRGRESDVVIIDETLEEAEQRIGVRYNALSRMTSRLAQGSMPSLIVSGPPGLGKSHAMREALAGVQIEEILNDTPVKASDWVGGGISAVGLYKALWHCRDGGILVLDDCDEIFRDEVSLNLLKVALDSGTTRVVSWRREASWLHAADIPDSFDFQGHVCFLTNIDFEAAIKRGTKEAEHFKALIDRSMYLCLTLRARRDFIIRIRAVALGKGGMLVQNFGLTEAQADEVLAYIEEHADRFYNLSLRLAGQIALCMNADPDGWQEDIEATKMRTL